MNRKTILILLYFQMIVLGCHNITKPEIKKIESIYHPNITHNVYETWKLQFSNPQSAKDFKNVIEQNPWKWEGNLGYTENSNSLKQLRKQEENFTDSSNLFSTFELSHTNENGSQDTLIAVGLNIICKKMVYKTFEHWIITELKLQINHTEEIQIKDEVVKLSYDFFPYSSPQMINHHLVLSFLINKNGEEQFVSIDNLYLIDNDEYMIHSSSNNIRDNILDTKSVDDFGLFFNNDGQYTITATNLFEDYPNHQELKSIQLKGQVMLEKE